MTYYLQCYLSSKYDVIILIPNILYLLVITIKMYSFIISLNMYTKFSKLLIITRKKKYSFVLLGYQCINKKKIIFNCPYYT